MIQPIDHASAHVAHMPVRIYYEDTDAGGMVYHANYLKFFERARTEWLRNLGVEQDNLRQSEGLLFVVYQITVDYYKPARFNELLHVASQVAEVGKATLTLVQTLNRADCTLCRASVRLAAIADGSGRPCRIPSWLLERIL